MSRLNVFAYTGPSGGYPPFVSVNVEDDGKVMLHARSAPKADGSCGDGVSVEIPRSELADLIRGLSAIVGHHHG